MEPRDYYKFYHTDMDYLDLEEPLDYDEEEYDERGEVYQYGVPLNAEDDEDRYFQ